MRCDKCRKESVQGFKHLGNLCKDCFCDVIEKRIRKNIRMNYSFSKDDKVICIGSLNRYLVEKILGKMKIDIDFAGSIPKRSDPGSKILVQDTLDDCIEKDIDSMLSGSGVSKKQKNYISIIDVITDEEAALFCSIRKIIFSPKKKKKSLMKMVDKMQEKYAETKFAIRNSMNNIRSL